MLRHDMMDVLFLTFSPLSDVISLWKILRTFQVWPLKSITILLVYEIDAFCNA